MKKAKVILTLDDDWVNKGSDNLPSNIIAVTLTGIFKECLKGIDVIKKIEVKVTDETEEESDFCGNNNTILN